MATTSYKWFHNGLGDEVVQTEPESLQGDFSQLLKPLADQVPVSDQSH